MTTLPVYCGNNTKCDTEIDSKLTQRWITADGDRFLLWRCLYVHFDTMRILSNRWSQYPSLVPNTMQDAVQVGVGYDPLLKTTWA